MGVMGFYQERVYVSGCFAGKWGEGGGCSAIDRSIGSFDRSESKECDEIVMNMMNVVVATGALLNGTE